MHGEEDPTQSGASTSRGLVYERRNISVREGATPRDGPGVPAPEEELRPPFFLREGDAEEGIVERDPHGRFARYGTAIGEGAFKKVPRPRPPRPRAPPPRRPGARGPAGRPPRGPAGT